MFPHGGLQNVDRCWQYSITSLLWNLSACTGWSLEAALHERFDVNLGCLLGFSSRYLGDIKWHNMFEQTMYVRFDELFYKCKTRTRTSWSISFLLHLTMEKKTPTPIGPEWSRRSRSLRDDYMMAMMTPWARSSSGECDKLQVSRFFLRNLINFF